MIRDRRYVFSLHELLIIAALAALGGVSGGAISMIRAAVHALVVLPGGMQFLAGIHVLWLVLAVGLVRKPGAATVTGLLQGTVELLSGNPHGVLVLLYSGLAGVGVDAVWILLGGRDRPTTYMFAGGVGSASNVLALKLVASLPGHGAVYTGLALMAGIAFVSGAVFAGLLGCWLLRALRLAGAIGARPHDGFLRRSPPTGARITVLGVAVVLLYAVVYLASAPGRVESADGTTVPRAVPGHIMPLR